MGLLSTMRENERPRKEEEQEIWEQREFHAPFIVVAQSCILDLHEHYALL